MALRNGCLGQLGFSHGLVCAPASWLVRLSGVLAGHTRVGGGRRPDHSAREEWPKRQVALRLVSTYIAVPLYPLPIVKSVSRSPFESRAGWVSWLITMSSMRTGGGRCPYFSRRASAAASFS